MNLSSSPIPRFLLPLVPGPVGGRSGLPSCERANDHFGPIYYQTRQADASRSRCRLRKFSSQLERIAALAVKVGCPASESLACGLF